MKKTAVDHSCFFRFALNRDTLVLMAAKINGHSAVPGVSSNASST